MCATPEVLRFQFATCWPPWLTTVQNMDSSLTGWLMPTFLPFAMRPHVSFKWTSLFNRGSLLVISKWHHHCSKSLIPIKSFHPLLWLAIFTTQTIRFSNIQHLNQAILLIHASVLYTDTHIIFDFNWLVCVIFERYVVWLWYELYAYASVNVTICVCQCQCHYMRMLVSMSLYAYGVCQVRIYGHYWPNSFSYIICSLDYERVMLICWIQLYRDIPVMKSTTRCTENALLKSNTVVKLIQSTGIQYNPTALVGATARKDSIWSTKMETVFQWKIVLATMSHPRRSTMQMRRSRVTVEIGMRYCTVSQLYILISTIPMFWIDLMFSVQFSIQCVSFTVHFSWTRPTLPY